jgi:hypothetical protein
VAVLLLVDDLVVLVLLLDDEHAESPAESAIAPIRAATFLIVLVPPQAPWSSSIKPPVV